MRDENQFFPPSIIHCLFINHFLPLHALSTRHSESNLFLSSTFSILILSDLFTLFNFTFFTNIFVFIHDNNASQLINKNFFFHSFFSAEEFEGEQLTINKVSRLHMGAYLCIATNGVQPSVSHRIILNVHCKSTLIPLYPP